MAVPKRKTSKAKTSTKSSIPANWMIKPVFEKPFRRSTTDNPRHNIEIDGILYMIWLTIHISLSTSPKKKHITVINGTAKIPTRKLKTIPTLSSTEYLYSLSFRTKIRQARKNRTIMKTNIVTLSAL